MSATPTPMKCPSRLLSVALIAAGTGLLGYLLVLIVHGAYDLSRDRIKSWSLQHDSETAAANAQRQLEIIDEVIEGDTSLTEAAAEFRRLHEQLPAGHRHRLQANYPEANGPHLFERRVIFMAAGRLEAHPEEQAVVLQRLERELQELREQREQH